MNAQSLHEVRHLPVAQREAQVPTHTHENDWAFVMPPEERIGGPNGHRFSLPQPDSGFSQHNRMALSNAKIQRREAWPLSGRWKDRSLNNSGDGNFLLDWIPWQTRASLVRKERGGHHVGVNKQCFQYSRPGLLCLALR